jgi:predicted DNA-binding transcriptional regulator AlpA
MSANQRAKISPVRARTARDHFYNEQPSRFRLYRTMRLAKLFDVNATTIWRWKNNGTLPPPDVKMPGFEAWTEEQIQGVIKQRRQETTDAE